MNERSKNKLVFTIENFPKGTRHREKNGFCRLPDFLFVQCYIPVEQLHGKSVTVIHGGAVVHHGGSLFVHNCDVLKTAQETIPERIPLPRFHDCHDERKHRVEHQQGREGSQVAFVLTAQGMIRMALIVFAGYFFVMLLDFRRIQRIPMDEALKNME